MTERVRPCRRSPNLEAIVIGALLTSARKRKIEDSDQRLAWLLVATTIPVGTAGLALASFPRTVLGKPIPSAIFLTSYFESRTLKPFAVYCAVVGVGSLIIFAVR